MWLRVNRISGAVHSHLYICFAKPIPDILRSCLGSFVSRQCQVSASSNLCQIEHMFFFDKMAKIEMAAMKAEYPVQSRRSTVH